MSERYLPMPSGYAQWLLEAKEEHTKFEANHGKDEHWEKWYGLYMAYRADGIDRAVASGWTTIDLLGKPGVK